MRLLLAIFLISSSIGLSQNDCNYTEREVISLFKHINKTDASNIDQPEIREKDFHKNFDTIIKVMNCADFEIEKGNYSKRQKRNIEIAIGRTLIHIFQNAPERILNDSFIALIKSQLESANLKKSTLIIALSVYRYDYKDDFEDLELYFMKALKEWDIHIDELAYS
ncbi:hypothetical protein ERX46_13875 [Brumimicrobium glaciale]|uniref:Uncharacterized protein n=1 Tax=Brumimicrobium glaciale TaxID=200475 RepID=A0A4V1WF90_9FLAO|nr:hypothetical protein [Brumimicrobium glaciale]RYM32366.1 hypothetical protein ERX46_13875 [Brumimicrobium glaciale]